MPRMKSNKEETDNTLQSLQIIPGVGPKLVKKLYSIVRLVKFS